MLRTAGEPQGYMVYEKGNETEKGRGNGIVSVSVMTTKFANLTGKGSVNGNGNVLGSGTNLRDGDQMSLRYLRLHFRVDQRGINETASAKEIVTEIEIEI